MVVTLELPVDASVLSLNDEPLEPLAATCPCVPNVLMFKSSPTGHVVDPSLPTVGCALEREGSHINNNAQPIKT